MELPASLKIENGVTIQPAHVQDLRSRVSTRFAVDDTTVAALERIARGPFVFRLDPTVDPLERIATPGASAELSEDLLKRAKVKKGDIRTQLGRLLRRAVLPVHESFGHVRVNLDPQQIALETELIWQTICKCLVEPDLGRFLDQPDALNPGWLAQFYLNEPIHELYALLTEESAWKQIEDAPELREEAAHLKSTVRGLQDTTAVELLELVLDKTNSDVPKMLKLIRDAVTDNNLGLSHTAGALLQDLRKGIAVDKLAEVVSQGAPAMTFGLSSEQVQRRQERQKEVRKEHLKNSVVRAALSTFMTLGYEESNFTITFYSTEYTEESIRQIAAIDVVREARRILDSRGKPYPLYPMEALGQMMRRQVRMIADGKPTSALDQKAEQIDVVKEFRDFYLTWRPALVAAMPHRTRRS